MEIHSHIYYKHPDPQVTAQFDQLFSKVNSNETDFLTISASINSESGKELAQELIETVDSVAHDLGTEALQYVEGYSIAHFCHGSAGDEFVEMIVQFIQDLSPDIHVQAWASGDDDPWEFWIKFKDGELIRKDDEPLADP